MLCAETNTGEIYWQTCSNLNHRFLFGASGDCPISNFIWLWTPFYGRRMITETITRRQCSLFIWQQRGPLMNFIAVVQSSPISSILVRVLLEQNQCIIWYLNWAGCGTSNLHLILFWCRLAARAVADGGDDPVARYRLRFSYVHCCCCCCCWCHLQSPFTITTQHTRLCWWMTATMTTTTTTTLHTLERFICFACF